MVKKLMIVAVLAAAVFALTVAPALAEGYNNGGYNWTTNSNLPGYGANAGLYVRDSSHGIGQIQTFAGPHGAYTTTTNKCQDCHSTHYATGSYYLLRSNDRANACTFCHAGGGGSATNIQMDNAYDANGVAVEDTRGAGVGHSLGYTGKAPADINPAYTDADGFACFDCHTPHGNSARVLTTFADPGRALEPTTVVTYASFGASNLTAGEIAAVKALAGVDTGSGYNLGAAALSGSTTFSVSPGGVIFGLTPTEGNFVMNKNDDTYNDPFVVAQKGALKKPVWGTGRFLLLKDPDNELGLGGASDLNVAGSGSVAGTGTDDNPASLSVKLAINWTNPLGPADYKYGGVTTSTPANSGQNANGGSFPTAPNGILAVSEFCADCHSGAAGASTQPAKEWVPDQTDPMTGSYKVVYSHDAQPRH